MLCEAKGSLNHQRLSFGPLDCPCFPGPGLWVAPVELSATTPPGCWEVLLERRTGAQWLNYSGRAPTGMGDARAWDTSPPAFLAKPYCRLTLILLRNGKQRRRRGGWEKGGGGGGWRGRSQRLAFIPVESWPGDFAQGSPSIFPRRLAAPGLSRRRLHRHERSACPAPHFAGDILAKKVR